MLKGTTPLIVALVLAGLAGVTSFLAIRSEEMRVKRGWNLVPVVAASADIAEGAFITEQNVHQVTVPEQFVTASVIKPDSFSLVMGQRVLVPLQAGDPLLWSQFETTRAPERLSARVQKKGRAVTIDASKSAAVGGWIRPNDHVDVIGTFKDPKTNESVAVTLLQNVIVLATGKITGTTNVNVIPESQRDYSNVSLLVIPQEAEMVVLAQELGQLALTLRNEDDTDNMQDRGRATIDTLLSGERTKALEKIRHDTIQIIRGAGTAEKSLGNATP